MHQDIVVINNPNDGAIKLDCAQLVSQLGYIATLIYNISGMIFICGHAVIGSHLGIPLPRGFVSNLTTPINLDIIG